MSSLPRFFAILLLLGGLGASTLGFAAAAQDFPPTTILPGTRVLVASALEKVAEAEHGVQAAKDDQKALSRVVGSLSRARDLIALARMDQPTGEARALLSYLQLKLKIEDNREALVDLLPLERALEQLGNDPGLQHTRELLQNAKRALETPDHALALKTLEELDRTLVRDWVDLPLDAAADTIRQALDQIMVQQQPPTADLLPAAEKSLLQLLSGTAS